MWDENASPLHYMNRACANARGGLADINAFIGEAGPDIAMPALKAHGAVITEWLNAGIDARYTAQAMKAGGADLVYKMTQSIGVQNIKAMSPFASPESVTHFVQLASPEYTGNVITKMNVRPDILAKTLHRLRRK